jgi:hypothetical protein
MKTYLNAIEQILGTVLDRASVRDYEFSTGTLTALKDFASGYAKGKISLSDHNPKITCFYPFPEVLSGNFRTYSSNGSLEKHWPAFEELANLVMFCDRFIIHDHLEHYAASAIDGYAEGYRYTGLRNWLIALAEWKPLIMKDSICILPQDLACSGPLQSLWDEGEISGMASGVYYEMYPEAGNFSNGNEAEELLSELTEMEDFLTTLSIPVNRGDKFAPYYNNVESLRLHEATVEASLNIFRQHAFMNGDNRALSKDIIESENMARLKLDAILLPSDYNAADICRLRLEDQDFAAIREEIAISVRKFSENSAFLLNPSREFQAYLDDLQVKLSKKMEKFLKSSSTENNLSKQVTIGFAGMISGNKTGINHTKSMSALRSIFNNLPVKAQLPHSTCHYYISFMDK